MAPEEQSQKCSNSGGSGGGIGNFIRSSSKRQKAKKVPQRGLGVAQLEKIRIEEQHKKDVIVAPIMPSPSISPTTISSSSSSQKSPYLSLPIPNFHHPPNHPTPTPSIPFSIDLAAANLMFMPNSSAQDIEIPPWPPGNGNGNFQKVWSVCEHNAQKENVVMDPGLPLKANFSLNYESEPIWPLPSLMQRAQQNKQSSSAMVSSTSAPTLLNFQMEPPSNQIYNGNCAFLWSEEKMAAGMKRPYPFSLENPAGPSFHYKYPPINILDEQTSSGNGNKMSFDSNFPNFRGPPCSTSTSTSEPNSKKRIKVSDGDFLTLAPPVSTSMSKSSKSKDSSPNSAYYDLEFPDFETLPYHQGCMEDSIFRQGRGGLDLPQPYYSFLPPATGQATTTMTKCNGVGQGVRESVDLNLKL